MAKRILLTGGSGFIGRHCLEPLQRLGYEVHAVSTRTSPVNDGKVSWHTANLLDSQQTHDLVRELRPTHLLHLAWYVVPGKLISSLENYQWVTASIELLRQFAEQGGQRVVICGSGYEYDWNYGYCSEKLTPLVPNTVYGACKHALHLMSQSFAALGSLSLAWARVFFLYGPHEHPDRLVSSVIRSLLQKQPAKCSHGRQIRDYMHVQDVADGIVALLDSTVTGPVNVSSGQATTLKDIVLGIGGAMGRPDLVHLGALPARSNDSPLVVGENARLLAEVGWKQRYDLEAGIKNTIDWWREQLALV